MRRVAATSCRPGGRLQNTFPVPPLPPWRASVPYPPDPVAGLVNGLEDVAPVDFSGPRIVAAGHVPALVIADILMVFTNVGNEVTLRDLLMEDVKEQTHVLAVDLSDEPPPHRNGPGNNQAGPSC